jgi:hypothetical protein
LQNNCRSSFLTCAIFARRYLRTTFLNFESRSIARLTHLSGPLEQVPSIGLGVDICAAA